MDRKIREKEQVQIGSPAERLNLGGIIMNREWVQLIFPKLVLSIPTTIEFSVIVLVVFARIICCRPPNIITTTVVNKTGRSTG